MCQRGAAVVLQWSEPGGQRHAGGAGDVAVDAVAEPTSGDAEQVVAAGSTEAPPGGTHQVLGQPIRGVVGDDRVVQRGRTAANVDSASEGPGGVISENRAVQDAQVRGSRNMDRPPAAAVLAATPRVAAEGAALYGQLA